jgi:hypothetical protein
VTIAASSLITGSDRILELRGSGGGSNSLLRYSDGATAKYSVGFNNNEYIIFDDVAGVRRLQITSTGAATFSSSVTTGADATINGVTVGKGAGSIATNTAVGFEAGYSNTSGDLITAIGYQALKASTGSYNTAVGYRSLTANTTGNYNTALGQSTLLGNTTGSFNTALGHSTLVGNTTGSNNTAIGRLALYSNTASNNVAVGFEAGYSNTSGENITAIGYRALKANSTGGYNTAVGWATLSPNTTGLHNTAVGNNCLYDNITGNNNVVIGSEQGTGNYGNCIMLGRGDIATGGQQVRFGSAAIPTSPVVVGANVSSQYWNVFINGVAQKILLA